MELYDYIWWLYGEIDGYMQLWLILFLELLAGGNDWWLPSGYVNSLLLKMVI